MNMRKRFWEIESPQAIDTKLLRVSYFHHHGYLQFARLYVDLDSKEVKPGRVITLAKWDFLNHPRALGLVEETLKDWKQV